MQQSRAEGMGDSASASSTNRSRRRVAVMIRRGNEVQSHGSARVCYCGLSAPLCTSWTEFNPGRRFYGCRNYQQGGCGFFQWVDEEMGERSIHVINELVGHVDRLFEENMKQRVREEKAAADAQAKIDAIYVQMKKTQTRMRLAFYALVLTWVFFLALILG